MSKKLVFMITWLSFTMFLVPRTWAHGGVTPAQVITGMKHKQQGPYAAPLFRGRSLSQDWLGFKGVDYQNADVSGVLIHEIVEGGLADSEDIAEGDIIIAANEQAIDSLATLDDVMAALKPNSEVEFTLLRNGKPVKESIYVQASLREIAPEMNDIMKGKTRPQPGMMMKGMMAKTPLAGTTDKGGLRPGMFMEEMMQRSPMGQFQGHETSGQIIVKSADPLKEFLSAILNEISSYEKYRQKLNVTDKQLKSLHKLQLDYKKQQIKTDADFKIMQLELEEVLSGEAINLDKLEDVLQKSSKLEAKRQQQALNLLKEYFSLVNKSQRLTLKQLFSAPMGN